VASEEHEHKGTVGAVGGVLRQIPPTVVKPIILATVGRHAIVTSARCAPRGGTKVAARFRCMLISSARNGKIAKSDRQSISLKQRFSIAANQAEFLL